LTTHMNCAHHWVLATPAGPMVHGVCVLCGAERDYPTTMDSDDWKDVRNKGRAAAKLARERKQFELG